MPDSNRGKCYFYNKVEKKIYFSLTAIAPTDGYLRATVDLFDARVDGYPFPISFIDKGQYT